MSEDLTREVEKTAVRLKHLREREKEVAEAVSKFLNEIESLIAHIDSREKKIRSQKRAVYSAFEELTEHISDSEHERSHLFECFGRLLRQIEDDTQRIGTDND